MTIDDFLLGHWTNKYQAQSSPHCYAQVETIWEKIDGGYHSKNFYRKDGPSNPYRERYHKLVVISETEVVFENYDLDWTRSENCDMMFSFDGTAWHGRLVGDKCTGVKGYRVESMMSLYGTKLHSRDRGFNTNGEMVWGSHNPYKFIRTGD